MSQKLNVNFAGLELRSPIIGASGPFTRSVKQIQELANAGVGAVVTKSTSLEEEYKQMVKPYAPHRFPDCRPKYVSAGHDTYVYVAGLLDVPAEIWAESVLELKRTVDIPIIVSQIAMTIDGHVKMAEIFKNAGADAIELNADCPLPVTKGTVSGQDASQLHPEVLGEAVIAIRKRVDIPVGLKVVFSPVAPEPLLEVIRTHDVDFIHTYHAPTALSMIDLDTGKPYLPAAACGVTGPLKRLVGYRYVALAATSLGLDKPAISASGYVMNWRHCVEFIMYGCTALQVNHAIMAYGSEVITKLNNDLEKFLDEKGYSSITELRGMALPHLLPDSRFYDVYGKTKGMITAEVIPGRCNLCGICEKTCPVDAITVNSEGPIINEDLCEGCGLCVANCPVDALRLKNKDVIYSI